MTTIPSAGHPKTEFETVIHTWESRYKQVKLARWLPRVLLAAPGAGAVIMLLSAVSGRLSLSQALILAFIGMAIVCLIGVVMVLRPRPVMTAARDFDTRFGLQERLSTALELLDGRIHTTDEMTTYQIRDASAYLQTVDVMDKLPYEVRWREWLMLIPAVVVFCLTAILFSTVVEAAALNPATEQAIENAANQVRDMTETVATDSVLSAEERQTLLETLETSLETLIDKPLSADEAFATLQDVEQALSQQADRMRQQVEARQQALDSAAQSLSDLMQSPDQATTGENGMPGLEEVLQQVSENAPSLTEEQQQQIARELAEAASNTAELSPELARSLREASDALQEGDEAGFQESIESAKTQAQQAEQEMQRQSESAESLSDAAEKAQQAARDVAESEQPPAGEDESGEAQPSEADSSGDSESQPSEEGENTEGESGVQSAEGEAQSGENGEQSTSSEGNASAAPEDTENTESSTDTSAAGETAGSAGDNQSSGQSQATGSGAATTDNNPDGEGESDYEPIYAPQSLTTQGTENLTLEPDTGNMPVTEGNFQENSTGQSTVPYNQVFERYSSAVTQSLNNDYIPLSLRDVVQDYFTGLAPASGTNPR